jgi:hypothetical protein
MIQLHPSRYPTDGACVGLVGTLLSGTALAWFALFLKKQSPLLQDFKGFIKGFQGSFGDNDSMRTTVNKIWRLRQGDCLASTYVAYFRLLACDIQWDSY